MKSPTGQGRQLRGGHRTSSGGGRATAIRQLCCDSLLIEVPSTRRSNSCEISAVCSPNRPKVVAATGIPRIRAARDVVCSSASPSLVWVDGNQCRMGATFGGVVVGAASA